MDAKKQTPAIKLSVICACCGDVCCRPITVTRPVGVDLPDGSVSIETTRICARHLPAAWATLPACARNEALANIWLNIDMCRGVRLPVLRVPTTRVALPRPSLLERLRGFGLHLFVVGFWRRTPPPALAARKEDAQKFGGM